jgi:hypothetical protein
MEIQPPSWQRSRFCDAGSCVEATIMGDGVAVRDSKDPGGPILRFTPQEWTAFVAGVQAGDFRFDHTEA